VYTDLRHAFRFPSAARVWPDWWRSVGGEAAVPCGHDAGCSSAPPHGPVVAAARVGVGRRGGRVRLAAGHRRQDNVACHRRRRGLGTCRDGCDGSGVAGTQEARCAEGAGPGRRPVDRRGASGVADRAAHPANEVVIFAERAPGNFPDCMPSVPMPRPIRWWCSPAPVGSARLG